MGAVGSKRRLAKAEEERAKAGEPSQALLDAISSDNLAQVQSLLAQLNPESLDAVIMGYRRSSGDAHTPLRAMEVPARSEFDDRTALYYAVLVGYPAILDCLFQKASRASWPKLVDVIFYEPGFREANIWHVISTHYGVREFEVLVNEQFVYDLIRTGRLLLLKAALAYKPTLTIEGDNGLLTRIIKHAWNNFKFFSVSGLHGRIEKCLTTLVQFCPSLLKTHQSPICYSFSEAIRSADEYHEFALRLDLTKHLIDCGGVFGEVEKNFMKEQLALLKNEVDREAIATRFFGPN